MNTVLLVFILSSTYIIGLVVATFVFSWLSAKGIMFKDIEESKYERESFWMAIIFWPISVNVIIIGKTIIHMSNKLKAFQKKIYTKFAKSESSIDQAKSDYRNIVNE